MSEKEKARPLAIRIENCPDSNFKGTQIIGDIDGISVSNSKNIRFKSTHVMSTKAFEILSSLELELEKLRQTIPPELYEKLSVDIHSMSASVGSSTFKEKYQEFTSTLSNHITILTPLAAMIGSLAKFL